MMPEKDARIKQQLYEKAYPEGKKQAALRNLRQTDFYRLLFPKHADYTLKDELRSPKHRSLDYQHSTATYPSKLRFDDHVWK